MIFRREPLHKKLAREARLEQEPEPGPVDPGPHWGGDEVHFVTLPNGDLVVDEHEPPDRLGPLADAVEQTLETPYHAEAVRQRDDVWAVAARRIAVASFRADGDELELVSGEAGRTFTVDGERTFGSLPELERIGGSQGEHYVVRARRLDGEAWEIQADPL